MATSDQIAGVVPETTFGELAESFPEAMEYISVVFPSARLYQLSCRRCVAMTIADFAKVYEEDPENLTRRVREWLVEGYGLGPA